MKREKYEWANLWWDEADDPTKRRVLLIGDSITNGYRRDVQERLKELYRVDMLATSKAVDDPSFFRELRYMLADYPYDVVHFNNGLHGEHMTVKAYEAGLRKAVRLISAKCKNIIIAASTPVTVTGDNARPDEKVDAQVRERNEAAARVAADHGLPADDLYSTVYGRPELKTGDGYHFNGHGYSLLGESVAKAILDRVR